MDYNDAPTIAALAPNLVAAYLRTSGWSDGGQYGSNGHVYSKETGDRVHKILLPTRPASTDFMKRMYEVVQVVAEVELRSFKAALFDLTLTPYDVIRIRTRDADAYGSVRLVEGIALCEEAQNLVVASARAAASDVPRKAWKGRRPESINEYLQRVRFGQTEKSSFSLTVLSPYSFEPGRVYSQASLFESEAFGRRVTRKFASALVAIESALAEVNDPMRAFERSVGDGVSAELCDALGNIADNDVGVELSVSWSPAKPSVGRQMLSLSPRDGAMLKEVARVFSKAEPEPDRPIEGIVTQINQDPHSFDGSTVIEAAVEGRLRRVRINFETSQRAILIEAFDTRTPIRVVGELVTEGARLLLRNPRGLAKVEEPPENEGLQD